MSATLFDEHREIQASADAFLAALRETPRVPAKIHQLRAQLAKQMNRHRLSEEALIVGPFKAAGGFEHHPEILDLMQTIRKGWMSYSEHVRHWTPQAIEADWDGYAAAVEHRVEALRSFTAMEEREIYAPMLRFLERGAAAKPAGMHATLR
ncbi:MAG: hypothetical protein J7494_11120 [Sphingobium sp.]|nr:hypothetical protein [Sphingobium sp.]